MSWSSPRSSSRLMRHAATRPARLFADARPCCSALAGSSDSAPRLPRRAVRPRARGRTLDGLSIARVHAASSTTGVQTTQRLCEAAWLISRGCTRCAGQSLS